MLVCNVSLRPPRSAIAADVAELAAAVDATATGNVVFATLVDDPASVGEIVDAYLGEIMLEAASAADAFDANIPATYAAAVDEAATAAEVWTAIITAGSTTTFDGTPVGGAVVSGGGLTVTHTTTTNNAGVFSTAARSSGKYYFEMTVVTSFTNTEAIGIGSGAVSDLAIQQNFSGVALGGGNTVIFSNDATTGIGLGSTSVNDVFCFAADLTAKLFWARRNGGNWNNSGTANPATGVGGFTIEAGAFAPVVRFSSGGATDAVTGNFGASAYAQTPPVGFPSWA